MPQTSASGRKTTFEPKSTPKEQQKFPPQRRSVRGKTVIPKLQKDQSTLTQLEWVGTPNASRDVIIISSDHEDGDFEEPRPKKRRRKQKSKFDEKEAGQSTLTQFEKSRLSALGGSERFEIWEDYDPEQTAQDIGERQDSRRRKLPWLRQNGVDGEREDDGGAMPEIPETSQQEPTSSPARVDSGVENHVVQAKHLQLQTPKKVHFTEVPSSQTPPSTRMSTRSRARNRDSQRSPLKERSTNVQPSPSKRSPESQNISMKMLENVRLGMRKVPLNDTGNHAVLMPSIKEKTEAPAPRPLPKLQRVTTVQDSQADDLDPPDTQVVIKSPVKPARSPAKPTRSLKRVNTVQDSQFDDADLLLEEETNRNGLASYQSDNEEGAEGQHSYHDDDDDDVQATFDPANSALDRDAARFGWTQTQRPLPDVHEGHEDSETDDEDLDCGCTRRTAPDVPQISSERSQELGETYEAPAGRSDEVAADESPAETELQKPPQDDSAYESSDHVHTEAVAAEAMPSSPPLIHPEQPDVTVLGREEAITIPSSPLPHPSQISTVVPTQCSPTRPSSRHSDITSSSLRNIDMTIEEASTIATSSPHKSYPVFQNTWRSSSPLPLPPWSSPSREAAEKNGMVMKGGMDLVDWSLPPPPSTMRGSSSRRGTPASSLR
ncbi:hypothetical protein LTR37_005809 [Vermiconidia calcicola]|uniref:Uncharacterized protein n=1 Tax=Vermiconidia calcicola TaxID=1690605 RepID=A0ACC3NIK1_9PEZI|nr:hypothetical protein LTR37_005809 [Vermiconidia calcicola]